MEEERANAMTIAKFAPLYYELPETKAKRSAGRDEELLGHVVRIMGDKLLAEISRQDLFDYLDKRRGETLFRCGKWTDVPGQGWNHSKRVGYFATYAQPCPSIPRRPGQEKWHSRSSIGRVVRRSDAQCEQPPKSAQRYRTSTIANRKRYGSDVCLSLRWKRA
jgi:hypothetical protein